jgi:hypothetical protein
LCELVIDQRSVLAGREDGEVFSLVDYEMDVPRIFQIPVTLPEDVQQSDRGVWWQGNTPVDELVELTPEIYQQFRTQIAKHFSRTQQTFNAYLRGRSTYQYGNLLVPVTPIYFEEKESGCSIVGAKFCKYL